MDLESIQYFRNRERMERAAAKAAVSFPARRAHQELAELYASLASVPAEPVVEKRRTLSILPFARVASA